MASGPSSDSEQRTDLDRRILCLNKADLYAEVEIPAGFAGRDDVRVISAVRGDGIPELLEEAYALVSAARGGEGDEIDGE